MNIETLNELMKLNGIKSYFHLAKEIPIPYTTLLDLIKGRGERVSNIKTIADFFGVEITYLIGERRKIITINERNNVIVENEVGYNTMLTNLLSN